MALWLRFLRPPVKPDVRISRIRLTDGLLRRHACYEGTCIPGFQRNVTPPGFVIQHGIDAPVNTWPRCTADAGVLALFKRVIGSCDHALALTSLRWHDQSRVPSLDRPCRPASAVLRTPRTPARHDSPSPSAYRNRLRPTWAAETGLSCSVSGCVDVPSSIPRGCPASLPVSRCSLLPSPWHERLGLPIPFRVLISRGCKVHLSIGPANLLPSRGPCGHLRAFDAPLGRSASRPIPQSLLHGASALTAAGLSPASLIQHDSV